MFRRRTVVHRGKSYTGENDAIIDIRLFSDVQARLAANHHRHTTRKTRAASCPLAGKIFNADGQPMRTSFSYGRGKKMYRYYVSDCLLPNGKVGNTSNMQGMRLPASKIENLLTRSLSNLPMDTQTPYGVFELIARVTVDSNRLHLALKLGMLVSSTQCADVVLSHAQRYIDPETRCENDMLTMSIPIPTGRKGRTIGMKTRRKIATEDALSLASLVRVAHEKLREHGASPMEPAKHTTMRAPIDAWSRRRIAIGLLAPDIQKAILQGTVPGQVNPEMLLSTDFPLDWDEQRQLIGMIEW